jgi:hypothetical protein
MQAPVLVRMKSLASTAFGGPDASMDWCAGWQVDAKFALLADDQIALWSLDGKRLTGPSGSRTTARHRSDWGERRR